jgi:hypothetical protein
MSNTDLMASEEGTKRVNGATGLFFLARAFHHGTAYKLRREVEDAYRAALLAELPAGDVAALLAAPDREDAILSSFVGCAKLRQWVRDIWRMERDPRNTVLVPAPTGNGRELVPATSISEPTLPLNVRSAWREMEEKVREAIEQRVDGAEILASIDKMRAADLEHAMAAFREEVATIQRDLTVGCIAEAHLTDDGATSAPSLQCGLPALKAPGWRTRPGRVTRGDQAVMFTADASIFDPEIYGQTSDNAALAAIAAMRVLEPVSPSDPELLATVLGGFGVSPEEMLIRSAFLGQGLPERQWEWLLRRVGLWAIVVDADAQEGIAHLSPLRVASFCFAARVRTRESTQRMVLERELLDYGLSREEVQGSLAVLDEIVGRAQAWARGKVEDLKRRTGQGKTKLLRARMLPLRQIEVRRVTDAADMGPPVAIGEISRRLLVEEVSGGAAPREGESPVVALVRVLKTLPAMAPGERAEACEMLASETRAAQEGRLAIVVKAPEKAEARMVLDLLVVVRANGCRYPLQTEVVRVAGKILAEMRRKRPPGAPFPEGDVLVAARDTLLNALPEIAAIWNERRASSLPRFFRRR